MSQHHNPHQYSGNQGYSGSESQQYYQEVYRAQQQQQYPTQQIPVYVPSQQTVPSSPTSSSSSQSMTPGPGSSSSNATRQNFPHQISSHPHSPHAYTHAHGHSHHHGHSSSSSSHYPPPPPQQAPSSSNPLRHPPPPGSALRPTGAPPLNLPVRPQSTTPGYSHHVISTSHGTYQGLGVLVQPEDPSKPPKVLQCDGCELRFARKHDLNRHRRIHNGEAPYLCGGCNKSFKRSDARKRHWDTDKDCYQRNLDSEKI